MTRPLTPEEDAAAEILAKHLARKLQRSALMLQSSLGCDTILISVTWEANNKPGKCAQIITVTNGKTELVVPLISSLVEGAEKIPQSPSPTEDEEIVLSYRRD